MLLLLSLFLFLIFMGCGVLWCSVFFFFFVFWGVFGQWQMQWEFYSSLGHISIIFGAISSWTGQCCVIKLNTITRSFSTPYGFWQVHWFNTYVRTSLWQTNSHKFHHKYTRTLSVALKWMTEWPKKKKSWMKKKKRREETKLILTKNLIVFVRGSKCWCWCWCHVYLANWPVGQLLV